MTSTDRPVPRGAVTTGSLWWAVVGAAIGVGLVAILTVGVLALALGLVLAVVGARSPRLRRGSPYALLCGAAVAPGLLAWLNRDGPGEVCRVRGDVTACTQQWSPWPFLAIAVVLVVAGVGLALRATEPSPGPAPPRPVPSD